MELVHGRTSIETSDAYCCNHPLVLSWCPYNFWPGLSWLTSGCFQCLNLGVWKWLEHGTSAVGSSFADVSHSPRHVDQNIWCPSMACFAIHQNWSTHVDPESWVSFFDNPRRFQLFSRCFSTVQEDSIPQKKALVVAIPKVPAKERMICKDVQMNSVTCNALIGSCDQAGQWQRAFDVLLSKKRRSPDAQQFLVEVLLEFWVVSSDSNICRLGCQVKPAKIFEYSDWRFHVQLTCKCFS